MTPLSRLPAPGRSRWSAEASPSTLRIRNPAAGRSTHQNHLRTAENVLAWLDHARALARDDVDELRALAAGDPALSAALLEGALGLRSAIHAVGAAVAHRAAPSKPSLAALSSLYARPISRAGLALGAAGLRWRWAVADAPVEAALGPIALAAVRLFTEADVTRIKECGGHACGWLFYDATKNKGRRWCEMEVCGNRAKQKRLAARRRGP